MNVLVTGANGFVGSNLIIRLLENGHYVIALSRQNLSIKDKNIQEINCDLANIGEKIIDRDIDVIFHLAASINFKTDIDSMLQVTKDNLIASDVLADFALKFGVKKIIFSSSCSVYKENFEKDVVIDEHFSLLPPNFYGISKLSSELLFEARLLNSTSKVVFLRYSSIYGPGQKKNTILPIFINNAQKDLDINIYGSGRRIQDYVYIDDVIDVNLKCLNVDFDKNHIFNIGSGEQISDLQLANAIKNEWRAESSVNILNREENKQEAFFNYSIKKAADLLNYKPVKLSEGLKRYRKATL